MSFRENYVEDTVLMSGRKDHFVWHQLLSSGQKKKLSLSNLCRMIRFKFNKEQHDDRQNYAIDWGKANLQGVCKK